MAKIVRYNGGRSSYYECTEPTNLIVGKEYEVVSENVRQWQTDYILKGVEGNFNSTWFDEKSSSEPIFMAIAHSVPIAGKRCMCSKLEIINGILTLEDMCTSTVNDVYNMGNNIYRVTTRNSIYFVQVG